MEVVDGLVHANVESLLVRCRVIEGEDDAFDQIADVDEVAFHGFAGGIEHQGHGVALGVFGGVFGADESAPVRSTEDVFAERERIFEVVFFHDPRSAQATAGEIVLNKILFEHHFFQNFGERVAAGVGGVFLLLGDG